MEDDNKQIILGKLHELIGEKFGNYSRYVIQDRALPNINDGLKPVQRRILYAMYKLKLTQKNSYKKSARVVGDVIGKYHPHGDTSVYEAMVRMSQTWKMSLPLVDMQGNNGSIDGDSAAAMRYTEARMHEITNYLIGDIDKEIVDFVPNFDDTEKEPVVLPSLFPNLIINGATGIASGYSTNIPPHNFNEVLNGLIYVLKNEEINIKELNKIIKGPDFPTGGIIEGKKDILKAYKGGQGKIIIKSKINYDSSRNALIVSEIPFEVNKSNLIKKIDELINSASISTISEVIDETDKTGLQIAILLKKDSNYNSALSFLYQKTDLLKSYSFNMIAIHNRSPQLFSLIEFLKTFSHFTYHNYLKLFDYELNKVNLRLEIIEGIVKAIAIIDEIIALIRKSNNKSQAKEALIQRYNFSENQAEAILNLRLYRLSSTDIIEFEKEKAELLELQKHYQKGLKDKTYLIDFIVSNLEEINSNFIFPRRTKILSSNSEQTRTFDVKDLLKEEKVRIILTKKNLIKVLNEQEKNKTPKIALDDMVLFDQEVSNFKSIFLFTNHGKYYSSEIFKLPLSKSKENSKNLNDIFSFAPDERIISIMFSSKNQIDSTTNKLVISTKYSYIKTIKYDLSLSTSKNGVKIIKLNTNDFVVSYNNVYDDNGLINVVTNLGFILRYPISSIPLSSFGAQGVINIKLDENDYVVGVIEQDSNSIMKNNKNIIIVSQDGKLKKVPLKFIRETTRTRKGQKISPEKNLNLIKIFESEDNDFENLFYLTQSYTQGSLSKKDLKISKSTTSKIWFELKDNLIDVSDNSYIKLVKQINSKNKSNLVPKQKTNNFFNF